MQLKTFLIVIKCSGPSRSLLIKFVFCRITVFLLITVAFHLIAFFTVLKLKLVEIRNDKTTQVDRCKVTRQISTFTVSAGKSASEKIPLVQSELANL